MPEDNGGKCSGTPSPCRHDLAALGQPAMEGAIGTQRCTREIDRYERRQVKGQRRQWIVTIDVTYHATMSEKMDNLIVMSERKDPRRQTTR